MSLDDAKKAGLPAEYAAFATDFVTVERWIETVYSGLTKK
jgi:hypothetical protein